MLVFFFPLHVDSDELNSNFVEIVENFYSEADSFLVIVFSL